MGGEIIVKLKHVRDGGAPEYSDRVHLHTVKMELIGTGNFMRSAEMEYLS